MKQLSLPFSKAERKTRDERKAQIIEKIHEYGNLSYYWIAVLCDIHKAYARELTNELVEEGYVILVKEVLFIHQVNKTKLFALGAYPYNLEDDRFGLVEAEELEELLNEDNPVDSQYFYDAPYPIRHWSDDSE